MPRHRKMNKIVLPEGTRGSETSKYPEEKKETSIPIVAASEVGEGQTSCLRTAGVAGLNTVERDESNTEGKRDQRR